MHVNNVLRNLRIQQSEKPFKNLFGQFWLVLLGSFILAKVLAFSGLWKEYTYVYHAAFELICIFVAISSFLVVWHIYNRVSPVDNLVGFGFLIVAVFDLFHVYYFPDLNFYPPGRFDLSTHYWVLGRMSEALILLAATMQAFHLKINKWAGLIISLSFAFGFSYLVLFSPNLFPVLFTETEGLTTKKIVLEYIIITIFLLGLYNLKDKINRKDILTYRYIFIALLVAIPAELCFTVFKTVNSFYNTFGHVLKIAYYYYLFRGTFVSAVTYPYDKLEVAGKYMSKILNALPVGVMTFDNNLAVSFANHKAGELFGTESKDIVKSKNGLQKELLYQFAKTTEPVKNKIVSLKNSSPGTDVKVKVDVEKLDEWGYLCLMSEAKQEQELENLQLQTKTILNAVGTMVAIVDTKNNIIICNQTFADTLEMDLDEIKDMKLEELYKKLKFSRKRLPINHVRDKHNEGYEVQLITPRGNKKVIHYYPAIIYNVDGENIGSIIVASDLTQIKEEQQRLYQQEKLASLGQMAAGIVHEIKNPLTSIKGFSQLCAVKAQDERLKEYARMIEDAANQADRIVSDFLSFARPKYADLQECSLNEIIDSMRVMLESLSSKVDKKYILAEEDYKIMADANQVKQVILNIVKNAIEATEDCPNPEIIIHTGLNEIHKQVFLRITDNGIGMSPEEQLKVGTPFFTTKDKGTGLGLSICHQIIKVHEGSIHIESQPNKGTSFTISFPWQEAPDKPFSISR